MGRPRKLRPEEVEGNTAVAQIEAPVINEIEPHLPTQKFVKTSSGQEAGIDPDSYDLSTLDGFTPYKEGEPLPSALIKTNRRGIRYIAKQAEPRFMFRGNEFIKLQRGLGGKKTSLFWTYKESKPLHRRIRAYLRNKNFPGA